MISSKNPIIIGFLIVAILLVGCQTPELETRHSSQTTNTNTEKPLSNGLMKGDTPPDFSVMTIDGRMLSLEGLNVSKTPVLLYFFTTWCPYCMEDFSALSTLYADYEADIHIVAIGMDLGEDANKISQYRQRFPALSAAVFATGNMDVLSSYQIKYTTTKYAIGRDGKILYAGSGVLTVEQWRTLLDAMKK